MSETEFAGTAKGDTIGIVIANVTREIKEEFGTEHSAIGALSARTGAGAQILAMDEAVKNTNTELVRVYMPRDTKGGGGHGSLIVIGADDPADVRRAIEMALRLTDKFVGGIYVCDPGHMDLQYTASAGEVVEKAFGATRGCAYGMVCACPASIGIVAADTAVKAAPVDVISVATPDRGTTHTNEVIVHMCGEAEAVLAAVSAGREVGLDLLRKLGGDPEPMSEPYF